MNSTTAIILFIISLIAILTISRKNLWVAIIIGGIILSLISNPTNTIEKALSKTMQPTILLLAIALAEIPLIGMILENDLLKLFDTFGPKKASVLGPAIFGLLPIPGGAVLSCPIVNHSLHDKEEGDKVAANIWFRHILFLIYPLSPAFIVSTMIARINIITIIPPMVPLFVLALSIGVGYYLHDIVAFKSNKKLLNLKQFLPVFLIALAPIIQILLGLYGVDINIATFTAVSTILIVSILYYKVGHKALYLYAKRMKIWNFALILLSIVFYAEIFMLTSVFFYSRYITRFIIVIYNCSIYHWLFDWTCATNHNISNSYRAQ